jgi:hypothetical protein
MAAMADHGHGAILEKLLEADEMTALVRQDEVRHGVARLRRVLTDLVLSKTDDQLIHGGLEDFAHAAHGLGERLQPVAQGSVHVTAFHEGLFKQLR